tara:strand:+ start:510 stop:1043 length:534 start_codon:yes stop_codon:yes gene_type:complete
MAMYEWVCRECDIWWDRECDLGKAPKRTKCPECSTLSNRYWQQQNVGISFKDDGALNRNSNANDFHTVRRRYQKVAEEGFDKTAGDNFLRNNIRKSKEAMDDDTYRYKGAHVDWDKFAKTRGVEKQGEKFTEKKLENSRQMTMKAYDRANKMGYKDIGSEKLDIAKPNKNDNIPPKK